MALKCSFPTGCPVTDLGGELGSTLVRPSALPAGTPQLADHILRIALST
jgi:hypothetical protein